jgi:hypothetical protein
VIVARLAQRLSHMAALLAVALLCVASVKSTVMQATDGAMGGVPMCSAAIGGKTSGQADKAHKACEFCAAAAHAPLSCDAPTLPALTAIAWAPYRVQTAQGPRGPPAFRASARGPPLPTLTI